MRGEDASSRCGAMSLLLRRKGERSGHSLDYRYTGFRNFSVLIQGLPGFACLDATSTRRFRRGCDCPASGVQWYAIPLSKHLQRYGFTVKGFLLLPPLRPLVLASPPVAWSGLWGRPLLFFCPPLFLPLFPPS